MLSIITCPLRVVAEIPGANSKEFLVTILSEAKRPQTQCLSLKGEFWVCSEANSGMVKNSFQRAEGYLGNSLFRPYPLAYRASTCSLLSQSVSLKT